MILYHWKSNRAFKVSKVSLLANKNVTVKFLLFYGKTEDVLLLLLMFKTSESRSFIM